MINLYRGWLPISITVDDEHIQDSPEGAQSWDSDPKDSLENEAKTIVPPGVSNEPMNPAVVWLISSSYVPG